MQSICLSGKEEDLPLDAEEPFTTEVVLGQPTIVDLHTTSGRTAEEVSFQTVSPEAEIVGDHFLLFTPQASTETVVYKACEQEDCQSYTIHLRNVDNTDCKVFVVPDTVFTGDASEVLIDVLKNDILCDNDQRPKIDIVLPPVRGTASVVEGTSEILYVKNADFDQADRLVYRIQRKGIKRFALVYILAGEDPRVVDPACEVRVEDDYITLVSDTISNGMVTVTPLLNDNICNTSAELQIVRQPNVGKVTIHNNQFVDYVLPREGFQGEVSLQYRVYQPNEINEEASIILDFN
ncbi:MAG: hypothetical protein ACFB0B_11375 [Thermonemataceae bacterium]